MPRRAASTQRPPQRRGASTDGRKSRRRDAEVLEAAVNIFNERGYADATMQDIADSLGILKGSLYYYLDTKEDLLYWLLVDIHDGVDKLLEEAMAGEDLRAIERLEKYVALQVQFNVRNLKRISIYYHEIDRLSPPRRKELVDRRKVHDRQIVGLVKQAQEDGDADATLNAKLLSNCIFGTIIWIYRWYRPSSGPTIAELTKTCVHFVRCGLSPAAAPTQSR
jgi:AcrR family transcriptional regulator